MSSGIGAYLALFAALIFGLAVLIFVLRYVFGLDILGPKYRTLMAGLVICGMVAGLRVISQGNVTAFGHSGRYDDVARLEKIETRLSA